MSEVKELVAALRQHKNYSNKQGAEFTEARLQAAELIESQAARIEKLEAALLPFSKLELPVSRERNAGAYLILHSDIRAAGAAIYDSGKVTG